MPLWELQARMEYSLALFPRVSCSGGGIKYTVRGTARNCLRPAFPARSRRDAGGPSHPDSPASPESLPPLKRKGRSGPQQSPGIAEVLLALADPRLIARLVLGTDQGVRAASLVRGAVEIPMIAPDALLDVVADLLDRLQVPDRLRRRVKVSATSLGDCGSRRRLSEGGRSAD
jgi:hypothetical protein